MRVSSGLMPALTKAAPASGRSSLLCSGALVVGLLASHGVAQAQTDGAAQTPAPAQSASPAAASGLQDVIVTAEKRETNVQRTPATLEVVGGPVLQQQRIVTLVDLNSVLINTQIVPIGIATQVIIRGIGNDYIDPRADPSVATTINGLFYARPLPIGFGFLDVSRVEDLSGPQGTLYGRDAAGGVLNIITNQPSQRLGGMLQVSGGNLGENQVTGVLNLPVTSDLALRFAYDRDRRDGYLGGYYDDTNTDTGRISAKWTPTSHFTAYVEANYSHEGGHGFIPESYPCGASAPWSLFTPGSCNALAPGKGASAVLGGHQDNYVASGLVHLDYDLGWATITSITGYVGTHERADRLPNGAYFTNTVISDSNDFSEELRIAGHDNAQHQGGLAWQVGTYLFTSSGDYSQQVIVPGSILPPSGTQAFTKAPQQSQAGYAQATYGITDSLRITGGVRYTADARGIDSSATNFRGTTYGRASTSSDKFTYKGALEYDVTPRNLVYATISTGYAAGGVSGGNPSAPPVANEAPAIFQPETITAYEVGSKNRFFDNRLQLNGDFYYYDFRNYQYDFPAFVQGGGGVSGLQIENTGPVTAYGIELSAQFAATPEDRFSASLSWDHATFGALNYAGFIPPATGYEVHLPAGSELVNDPPWSALLGYEHTWRLGEGSSITFGVNSKLSDRYLLIVASTVPHDYQNGFTMTDANAAYHWGDDKYSVRVWVKNIENAAVNIYGEGAGFNLYGIEPPRTYGVTATASF